MAQAKASPALRAAFGNRLSELTTIFSPPCPVTWLITTTKVPSQYPPFPTTGPASCDPPSWEDNIAQKGFGYYSPAICPSGFVVGCTASNDRIGEGFPAIIAGETAMYCVPRGFTCTSDTTDFRGGVWGFMRTTSANGFPATVGPALQIRWREEDLIHLATDPLTRGPITTSTSNFTPTPGTFPLPEATISTSRTLPAPVSSTVLQITSLTPTRAIEISKSSTTSEPTLTTTVKEESASSSSSPPTSKPISTSIQPGGMPAADNGGTTDRSGADGNASSSAASGADMAAMALSGTLIGIILGYFATIIFRRYRRYRAGEIERFLPFDVSALASRLFAKRKNGLLSHQTTVIRPPRYPGAELGTDGPIPELGAGSPLGTKENPAELGVDNARNSWVSRVSRIFTVKLRKEVWSV
ncbi:hypothetical protein F5Y00DRAFT_203068 [Daldinia vernicosa]|uniref:uncharacterized protein n=1 Tax=Daldinia vernicosa TaxID=114800 RepID=UPI0020087758|nr:uncharacterized protein F5Y00DRAFT_203068 [Daldinia vernicosa]KAI0844290.1 hypothetical protein F5Y00DRAFT_203068 [Daldinia vernicosa]